MIAMLVCSTLMLSALGWVLYVNSVDRKIFEKELAEDLQDDSDSQP